MGVEELPCHFSRLLPPFCVTFMTFSDGAQQQHEDEWTSPEDPFRRSERSWTGRTEIRLTEVLEEMQASAQFEESAPFDSAPFDDAAEPQPETPAMEAAPSTPAPATRGGTFRRRRPKTRQLQRGLWMQFSPEPLQELLERTHEWLENRGGTDWQVIPLSEDVGRDWMVYEPANAELQLILASTNARKLMRKPQPFASPLEAPLGKSSSLLKTKLGQTERHGAIWKSIIKKLIWSSQLAGKDQMTRVYVTDAQSVFDYLHKDATSTSTDKRMAIEGALLKETVGQSNADVRWLDGQQNMSNVLTKANAEKET